MHTLHAFEAQARQQEIARDAHHPSRLMAHEHRLAGRRAAAERRARSRARSLVPALARVVRYVVLAAGLAALT